MIRGVHRFLTREHLGAFLHELAASVSGPGELYLLGDTSHLLMGWIVSLPELALAAGEPRDADLEAIATQAANRTAVSVSWESPAEVISLPRGHASRHRPTGIRRPVSGGVFDVRHFDPYSVAFRLVARGDEADYRTVLRYLRAGWISQRELSRQFDDLILRVSEERFHQDPAEFRRKFKGLQQMWRADQTRGQAPRGARDGWRTRAPTPPPRTRPPQGPPPPTARPTSSR